MNSEMLTELRKLSEQDGTITAQAHRRLSLAALADVYEEVIEGRQVKADVGILKSDMVDMKKRSNIVDSVLGLGMLIIAFLKNIKE